MASRAGAGDGGNRTGAGDSAGGVDDDPTGDGPGPAVRLSAAARATTTSAIRDLLRHAQRPDVISLAGGLPAAVTFPAADLAEAASRLLAEGRGLQYGLTEGDPELRAWSAERLTAAAAVGDRSFGPDRVVVTSGSQQGLDLVARVLVDAGDPVVVTDPAYVGALQVLRAHRARLVGVPADGDGLDVERLADTLAAGLRPKLVHVVADFDNPSGTELSLARRVALAELADRYAFVVVEDAPYSELRFEGAPRPPVAAFGDHVVHLGSFSKIVAPGFRIGTLTGPRWLVEAVVLAKQATDLHTSTVGQAVLVDLVTRPGWLDGHLERLRPVYRRRRDALVDALDHFLPEARFDRPSGGMFCWLRLEGVDTSDLLPRALEVGVAFVPGTAFAVDRDLSDHLRLSYATAEPEALDAAVARLASVSVA